MRKHEAESGVLIVVNFNQEEEIAGVLDRVKKCYGKKNALIVDDGSTDRSARIAENMGFLVLKHHSNRGIGAAIATGLQYALANPKYTYVTIMSSNGKMQPEEINKLTQPLLSGECDYVQGSRFLIKQSSHGLTWFRQVMIPVFTLMASMILRKRFSDITCGFRCYTLELLRHSEVNFRQLWLEQYELEYYLHYWACRLGYRIKEVPVVIKYSHLAPGRTSKIKPFIGWWSMIRPFIFLSLRLRS